MFSFLSMPTLLIADDHPLFREALRSAIARVLDSAQVFEADSASALYTLVDAHPDADLLLLDLGMPGAQGFGVLAHLRSTHPHLPVVIVSGHEEPSIMRRALDHGAMGYIPKSVDSTGLGQAITHVLDGERWAPQAAFSAPAPDPEEHDVARRLRELTPQQLRVLQMMSTGLLNKQIAWELNVTEATVKAHVTAILRKLGANNRTQAVLIAGKLAIEPDNVWLPPEGVE